VHPKGAVNPVRVYILGAQTKHIGMKPIGMKPIATKPIGLKPIGY
jgi:hypothetical protein